MLHADALRIHPVVVQHSPAANEHTVAIDLGFGITMKARLLLPIDVPSLHADDDLEQAAGRAAHRFCLDWLAEDPDHLLIQITGEGDRCITGDLFNQIGESLTVDLLNVGHAEPVRSLVCDG